MHETLQIHFRLSNSDFPIPILLSISNLAFGAEARSRVLPVDSCDQVSASHFSVNLFRRFLDCLIQIQLQILRIQLGTASRTQPQQDVEVPQFLSQSNIEFWFRLISSIDVFWNTITIFLCNLFLGSINTWAWKAHSLLFETPLLSVVTFF